MQTHVLTMVHRGAAKTSGEPHTPDGRALGERGAPFVLKLLTLLASASRPLFRRSAIGVQSGRTMAPLRRNQAATQRVY